MTQKVLKIGNSAAVTLPKKSLKEIGIKIGDDVTVNIDTKEKAFIIKAQNELSPKDLKIAKLTVNFIERYRGDLEALARK